MPDPRRRVVIRNLLPQLGAGRHAVKRVVGDRVSVWADVYADGHDRVAAAVRYRAPGADAWAEAPMTHLGNDRWEGSFPVTSMGDWEYTVVAWIDRFTTWREALEKKAAADVDVDVHLAAGAVLLRDVVGRRRREPAAAVRAVAARLVDEDLDRGVRVAAALDEQLARDVALLDPRRFETTYPRSLPLDVDRERARFSTWYEVFPRSLGAPDRHGTLDDVVELLPEVADMGFDVLYLPPIHPIGTAHRKGRDNATTAGPDDVGSPWAIGSAEGGHTAVHPELGTLDDLERLVRVARDEHGIDVALDLAFQCSPDHPWVTEHPAWFRHRPDGSIQYAENPPKKYQDIYPLDFESDDAEGLWAALEEVTRFWVDRGVTIFRVDNPHTKAFRFWEWLIARVRADHPEVLFLAEAFTRPRVMEELALRGFDQSYTYFTWRVAKWELEEYFGYLTADVRDFMRPNVWPNTPDILPEHLQHAHRPAFVQRLVLAATLAASYGMYGPVYELMETEPVPGKEEYARSEKYELRAWDRDRPDSLRPVVRELNRIRHAHPALQTNDTLRFHHADDEQVVAYTKTGDGGRDVVLVVVNLDPHATHGTTVRLDLGALEMAWDATYEVHDLLGGGTWTWQGSDNYVELDPWTCPAHVFHLRPPGWTEPLTGATDHDPAGAAPPVVPIA